MQSLPINLLWWRPTCTTRLVAVGEHWLLASAEDSHLMAGAFFWETGLWASHARKQVVLIRSTLCKRRCCRVAAKRGLSPHCNGESKLPHCFWKGLARHLHGVHLPWGLWASWVLAVSGISSKSKCSHFQCSSQWNVEWGDVQFAIEVRYLFSHWCPARFRITLVFLQEAFHYSWSIGFVLRLYIALSYPLQLLVLCFRLGKSPQTSRWHPENIDRPLVVLEELKLNWKGYYLHQESANLRLTWQATPLYVWVQTAVVEEPVSLHTHCSPQVIILLSSLWVLSGDLRYTCETLRSGQAMFFCSC